jgi:Glycogen recognition site of AMP-activated protein kinase
MGARMLRVVCVAAMAWLLAAPARAAVRVDGDEVIFSLRMPNAHEVYLVGDFNQWNPTVEPMNLVDEHFEVGLFLVAGEYRYQFVVDGKLINDPDNPMGGKPVAGAHAGSPLVLIERGDGLVLSTEASSKTAPVEHAKPGVRYIGAMRTRDDTDVTQRVDLTVAGKFDALDARASVATNDSSWAWNSGPSIDVWFDRARVDVKLGKLFARGFENDSTWVSADPTRLVGNAGIYDYDAGFRRHGLTATLSGSHAVVRTLYADATTRAPANSVSFAPAPDSGSVYDTRYSFDGSDVLAAEATFDFSSAGAGVVFRREAGVNPGVAAALDPAPLATDDVYATRENRAVSSVWAHRDRLFGLSFDGAYGWGSVKSHASGTASDTIAPGASVDAAIATQEIDRTFPVMETWRGLAEIGAGSPKRLHGSARWDFTRFDFDGLRGKSRADVHRATIAAADSLFGWMLDARVRYTHADYGDTPDALAIDWPELNPWLSIWDDYDEAAIVGLAFDRYDVATLSAGRAWPRVAAKVDLTAGLRGVADDLVHASVRAHADADVRGPWHAGADLRTAWYDAEGWTSGGFLWSGYLEGSYRRGPFELSAGYGFDPLVFNPVTAEYNDIGYAEFLRGALFGGVTRSRADDIVRALIEQERLLEDASVFKIELVVDLR